MKKAMLLVAIVTVISAAPALARASLEQNGAYGIRGYVTDVSDDAVLVEEEPGDESGAAKGSFTVTGQTRIFRQREGELSPAAFGDLRVGQEVEATYTGPVAESYPTQGTAGRIVILREPSGDGAAGGPPDGSARPTGGGSGALPDTGGGVILAFVLGVALITCGLIARRAVS